MPLYMDIHGRIEEFTADAIVQDQEADLKTQQKYGIKYLCHQFDDWLLMILLRSKKGCGEGEEGGLCAAPRLCQRATRQGNGHPL